jgi:radical SAM superfamily enzyme YgiQ (UPF0313 family)
MDSVLKDPPETPETVCLHGNTRTGLKYLIGNFTIAPMETLSCLFLHVPKMINHYRPLNDFIWVNFLPMGLLALADLLQRQGMSSQIVHLGVEWIEDHEFSVLDYIKERDPRIVAFDLHWHHQSYDVMELVRKVKAEFPAVYIVLGGFTASFFHEEIMRDFDSVDAIIRGEAEVPLLGLAQTILQEKNDLFAVPNLTWRRKGRVLVNALSYVASEGDLKDLSFTHLNLLKNYPIYIRYIGQPFYAKRLSKERNRRAYSLRSPVYHLPVGRGCPVQCTWCSGGVLSQRTITGREEVIFREIEDVLRSIKEAVSYGYETFHIRFDPYPYRPEYFLNLFSRIREEKIPMECCFESYGLPKIEFIKSFKKTFPGTRSFVTLSPEVGSHEMRKIHKGYSYTNEALMECLDQLLEHKVFCDLFFTLGLPFEREEDLQETLNLQRKIRKRYSNVRAIRTFTKEIEPGAPWHLESEEFGLKTPLRTFMDFYRHHSGEGSAFSSLGYWVPDYFQGVQDQTDFERTLQKMRCRHFCSIHPDARKSSRPFWGRCYCGLSNLFWKIKGVTEGKI